MQRCGMKQQEHRALSFKLLCDVTVVTGYQSIAMILKSRLKYLSAVGGGAVDSEAWEGLTVDPVEDIPGSQRMKLHLFWDPLTSYRDESLTSS